ncbi:hypothetical protein [Enterococcus hirae]|uniref:hypothetical protein n=1 Tax=Enterococcus hirae TaxID=1354 RepID=UPI003563C132
MLLIKFMFTLIYYGSFIYTVYKVGQIQQEYSDIMALYKQERERTFPNLTEQEQKKRKKAISQYNVLFTTFSLLKTFLKI